MLSSFRLPTRATLRALYLVAGLAAGAISLAAGQSQNFDVFCAAARALLRGHDLYAKNAAEYFKYSPTFALVFVPFAAMPAWIAAPLWSLANFAAAFVGIDRVVEDDHPKRVALLVALGGILVATDGDQSNLLVGAAVLLALHAVERGRASLAGALFAGAALVKLFPIVGLALVLLAPRGRGRALAAFAIVSVLAALLPLAVVGPRTLFAEYLSWHHLVARDAAYEGWSAMSLARSMGVRAPNGPMQLVALAAQAVPAALALRFGADRALRRTLACSLLVFFVLFNHRAEYATFVLSAIAAGVWCASAPRSWAERAMVVLALLAPGPFFARPDASLGGPLAFLAAHRLYHPLRVAPLLALWLAMQRELLARFVEVSVRWKDARSHAP